MRRCLLEPPRIGRGSLAPAAIPPEATIGAWVNVTPAGVSLNIDFGPGGAGSNFGAQDVVVDPVRPQDVYAFFCYQGVWRSQDYGKTYTKVSTGTNQSHLESGRPWTAQISKSLSRDPNTSPTLWTVSGYGDQYGIYRSTNWGVDWSNITISGPTSDYEDVYAIDLDPYDDTHLIATFHGIDGVMESTDSGSTWHTVTDPTNGISGYPFFIDTGSATTTKNTWIHVPSGGEGTTVYQTSDEGVTWTAATSSAPMTHAHGCSQIATISPTEIYLGADGGVWKTADGGLTWSNQDSSAQNGIVATNKTLIATFGWAYQGDDWGPRARQRALAGGSWSDMTMPAGITIGAKRMALTTHAGYGVTIGGFWHNGLWRYVEAA